MNDLQAEEQALAATRQQSIGDRAPEAEEPLDATTLKVMHDMMNEAAMALGDGQMEPIPPPAIEGESMVVPPETFAGIAALEGFAASVGEAGAPYTGMTGALISNEGLGTVTNQLEAMAKDKALARAAKAAIKAEGEEQPEAEATEQPEKKKTTGRRADELVEG